MLAMSPLGSERNLRCCTGYRPILKSYHTFIQDFQVESIPPEYISATELFHKDPTSSVQLFQVTDVRHIIRAVVADTEVHAQMATEAVKVTY
ncbi:xanthine dehydrogenase/oxidase-like [Mobula hypostoma]|uniref:xanthine dehydrogenase/oxidase-like n=1 Tax=Mobula hypostoma TaxID=723540 RepID=UPI002FC34D7C